MGLGASCQPLAPPELYRPRKRRYADEILVNMQRRFGYSKESALDTILFALRKHIIDFEEIIS